MPAQFTTMLGADVAVLGRATPTARPFSTSDAGDLGVLEYAHAALPRALGERHGDVGRDRPGRLGR